MPFTKIQGFQRAEGFLRSLMVRLANMKIVNNRPLRSRVGDRFDRSQATNQLLTNLNTILPPQPFQLLRNDTIAHIDMADASGDGILGKNTLLLTVIGRCRDPN